MAKKKLTAIVIDALEDIKARDIKLVNVSKITSEFDYIAVASAESTRQTKALARNVINKVLEHGFTIYGSEGEQTGEWVLVDCGDIVVHVMQPAIREYYKLEELWADGKVEFPAPKRAPRAKAESAEPAKKTAAKPKTVSKKKAATTKTTAKTTSKATTKTGTKTTAKTTTKATVRKKAATTAKVETKARTKTVAKKVAAKKPAVRKKTVA